MTVPSAVPSAVPGAVPGGVPGGVSTAEPATLPASAEAVGLDAPDDPYDIRLASGATGLLRPFNAAGVLAAADVHVAVRLGELGGEASDEPLLAAALAVRAVRMGSVFVDLTEVAGTTTVDGGDPAVLRALPWPEPDRWVTACAASRLVAVDDRVDGAVGVDDRADGAVAVDDDAGGTAVAADSPNRARPLRLAGSRLYLDRYWRQEVAVAADLAARAEAEAPAVDAERLRESIILLFPGGDPGPGPDLQRLACVLAALRRLTVLSGGPGTGKTTTVARLLALLEDQPGAPLRVALAAPTGKAAARLQEAVQAEAARLPVASRDRIGTLEASTLHRLLGARPGSTRFRHNRTNRLPHDVVVVDETSMVSLTLMARLLEAVRPQSRLVLVGDAEQLASVEAGAVLGDVVGPAADRLQLGAAMRARLAELVPADVPAVPVDAGAGAEGVGAGGAPPIGDGVVVLQRPRRYGGTIGELAKAVRAGDADGAVTLLRAGAPDVSFVDTGDDAGSPDDAGVDPLRADVVDAAGTLRDAAQRGDVLTALGALERHRLLCAHRHGPYGVTGWTARIEGWLADGIEGYAAAGEWYVGRPVLVNRNDYELRLYNGDTGVVVAVDAGVPGGAGASGGAAGTVPTVRAAFARGGRPYLVHPARLSAVSTVHAMTVHRSQGSQFDRVSVVLPPADSPLLTRQLLYTALTRARRHVRVLGTEQGVRAAVERPIARATGLRERLWG